MQVCGLGEGKSKWYFGFNNTEKNLKTESNLEKLHCLDSMKSRVWRSSSIIFAPTLDDLPNELKIDVFGRKVSYANLEGKEI